jgi:hypothetical protein
VLMSDLDQQHLIPLFTLILLTFFVFLYMGYHRLSGIFRGDFPKDYFKLLKNPTGADLPVKAEQAARNWINLFEVPVLYYLLTMLLLWTQKTDSFTLVASWIFVLSRYAHTIVHLSTNKIKLRFAAYALGSFTLYITWIRLAFQLST